MSAGLIDIGANLAHDSFDHDLEAVLQRARDSGVRRIIVTGSSADSSVKAFQLAQQHPSELYATAGLHPHHASAWNADLQAQFQQLAAHQEVVAIGECGLDYYRMLSPQVDQHSAFVAQLQLAAQLHKPVFLHQRDAHADFLAILREHRSQLPQVVVHCFTDTRAALNDYLALDCHIGITGWICDERRGAHLLEAVGDIPDDRLLIETDAPYLMPRTAPKNVSRRNEPCYLPWVVKSIATARGQTEAQITLMTSRNALDFFGLEN